MIYLILFLLYTTLSSNLYALIPVIIILIFILAAAGLTRGVSIFNLFGIGSLINIGNGVGKGGSGKGLKSASAVRRNKMKATIAKSPKGLSDLSRRLGVRHLTIHLQKKQSKYIEKIGKNLEKTTNAKTNLGKKFYEERAEQNSKKAIKIEKKLNKFTEGKVNLATILAVPKRPLSNEQKLYREEGLKWLKLNNPNEYNILEKRGAGDIILGKIEHPTFLIRAKQTLNSAKPSSYPNYTYYFKEMTNSRILLARETAGIMSALYVASLLFREAKEKKNKQQQNKLNIPLPPQQKPIK